ncbi:cytochrome P450 [Thelephora terrestris]|uniref:Cytochrome P450 n=1 Tax=Thelephora terrestris TaxID=56493 RepID=A0A9P6HKY1_9AGAM|nr:cytochrome P450 [Thelephora terrestris]
MDYSKTVVVAVVVPAIWLLLKKLKRSDIADMHGPDTSDTSWSFILGHLKLMAHSESGGVEKLFLDNYGSVVRFKAPFAENRLWVADPKALHQIFHATSYLYRKSASSREMNAIIADPGLLAADGATHRRQRKAMMPAFGLTASRELLPRFVEVVDKLEVMWKDLLEESPVELVEIDVAGWLGRAALDVIGNAAFDYDFGALEGTENPLTRSYLNLLSVAFGTKPLPKNILISDASQYLPRGLLTWIFERDKSPGSVRMRENRKYAREVAKELIDTKRQNIENGEMGNDVLSLLIEGSGDVDGVMNDVEIASQVRTIMLAGQETTAKMMSQMLWELAKNPEYQTKLRAELDDFVSVKGNADFTATDLESLSYLNAVIKETLRVHTSVPDIIREVSEDTMLPLSKPVIGRSGKTYNEIFVPKGSVIHASLAGYNTNPDVWGSDARVFRPDRWFEQGMKKADTPLGIYGGLMTFSAGERSCIGWRFALIEAQAFMARLVREFQFSVVEGKEIRIYRPGLLEPLVVGEEDKGVQLPLNVSAICRGAHFH